MRVALRTSGAEWEACWGAVDVSAIRGYALWALAVALHAQGTLAFGKARELAGIDHYAFGQLLGQRGIPRQYGPQELADDMRYARGE